LILLAEPDLADFGFVDFVDFAASDPVVFVGSDLVEFAGFSAESILEMFEFAVSVGLTVLGFADFVFAGFDFVGFVELDRVAFALD
jgi:hypothetical protein